MKPIIKDTLYIVLFILFMGSLTLYLLFGYDWAKLPYYISLILVILWANLMRPKMSRRISIVTLAISLVTAVAGGVVFLVTGAPKPWAWLAITFSCIAVLIYFANVRGGKEGDGRL